MPRGEKISWPSQTRVVACRVFQPELLDLGVPDEQVIFLDQGLHRTPDELHRRLGRELAALEDDQTVDTVILAYGLCGGGLEGLSSRRLKLVVPLAHDCIPVLRGDPGRQVAEPGVFYLSAGWIDHGQTPLTEFFVTAERLGEDNAQWTTREILKHYREVALIDTPLARDPRYWAYAREMADLAGLACGRVPGSMDWLLSLLAARDAAGVRTISPSTKIDREMYPAGGATTTF
jgi:hypothetical protein